MTRSRKILLGLAAVVVIVVGLSMFDALPSVSLGSSQSADAALAQAKTLNEQANAAEAALQDKAAFEAELQAARDAVPPTPQLGDLITEVEDRAAKAGLTWQSGAPARSEKGETGTWGMQMVVLGDAGKVAAFVDSLQQMTRLVVVDSMNLDNNSDGDVKTTISLSFFSATGDLESFSDEQRERIQKETAALEADNG